jgi:CRP-like cAMP-binding protein
MASKINRLRESAFSLQAAGKAQEALDAFRELMKLAPNEIESARRAGDICRELGLKNEAIQYYETVVDQYVSDGLLLKAMSICKEIQGFHPDHAATKSMLHRLYGLQRNARTSSKRNPIPAQLTTKPKVSLQSILKRSLNIKSVSTPGLPTTPLFSSLPKNAFVSFVRDMQMRRLAQGDVIIREGETGSSFFVIVSGRVRVEKRLGKKRTTLAFLSDGAFFGEMALMHKAPRTASIVVASEECRFFEFDKKMVKKTIAEYPSVQRVMRKFCEERLLSTTMAVHPLFKAFHISVRRELMSLFRSRTFPKADVLIEEGKVSKGLYLVLSGVLEVQTSAEGKKSTLAQLRPGDMFGEMSILYEAPAAATVSAMQETRVLRLPAASFMKVAKVYPEVLDLLDSLAHERRSENQIRLSCPPPISESEGQAMV